MGYFTHIFNTSFFIILAIILLIAALLVVYFECKIRQQHHKIVSMLSLVSTLAEDMNEMKIRFNHSIISGGAQNKQDNSENLGITQNNTLNIESNVLSSRNNYNDEHNLALIEVSDDESNANDIDIDDIDDTDDIDDDTDDDTDDAIDADDVDHLNYEHNSSDEENEIQDINFNIDNIDQDNINDNKENNNIKVLIVNLLNDPLRDIETKNESTFDLDLDYSEDLYNFQPTYELPEIAEEYTKEILSLKYDVEPKEDNLKSDIVLEEEKEDKNENILQSIKSISINLGDENVTKDNIIDYKKIQLSKLRTIVVEKGLSSNLDASKLKKNEILKLLEVE